MKEYRLEMPVLARFLPLAVLVILTVGIPAGILTSGDPVLLLLPVLAVLGWNWWVVLTLAYHVVLHGDGTIEWVALGKRVRTRPEEIREIAPERWWSTPFFKVRHAGGKVRFVNRITGFHEVVSHIRSRNPGVLIRGL